MPAFYGGKLTTFEDDEKESEYGYVRKVSSSFLHVLCSVTKTMYRYY